MELRLFTELVDALGKTASGLEENINPAKPDRETMRDSFRFSNADKPATV